LDAEVDLNQDDGTPEPRIRISGEKDWINVDKAFVDAYLDTKKTPLKEYLPKDEKATACKALKKELMPEESKTGALPHLVLGGSILGREVLSFYILDKKNLTPMSRIAGFDDSLLKYGVLSARVGTDLITHAAYVSMHERLSPTARLGYDLSYLGLTAAGWALDQGDPAMQNTIQTFNTLSAANINSYAGKGWGSIYQLSMGALQFGLAFAVPTQTAPAAKDAYVDPSNVASHYNVQGNPYEQVRFPGLKTNLMLDGVSLFLWGAVQGVTHLSGGSTSTAQKVQQSVKFSLLPSADGRGVSGGYLGVDILRLSE
jgi:hypothetical protein